MCGARAGLLQAIEDANLNEDYETLSEILACQSETAREELKALTQDALDQVVLRRSHAH